MTAPIDTRADRDRSPGSGDRSPAPMGVARRTAREVGLALVFLGVVVFAFVAYELFGTSIAEANSQNLLQQSFDHQLGQVHAPAATMPPGIQPSNSTPTSTAPTSTTPTSKAVPAGSLPTVASPTVGAPGAATESAAAPSGVAIDHLVIPSIGIDKFVVQGTTETALSMGPGHYVGTPLPGQGGNVGIAGHRTTYGAPFFRLAELHAGDAIYLTDTSGTRYTYRMVSSAVVAPSDVSVLDQTALATLTLTTCNPVFSATSRLVVVANLTATTPPSIRAASPTRTTVPAIAGPTTIGPSPPTPRAAHSNPAAFSSTAPSLGHGNSSAWPPAAAFGAGAVLCWAAARLAINRTRRWSRVAAYIAGIVVTAVPLWFCFENVIRLLPPSV